ncbi:oxygenase MpaB family protein [Acinetobacter shaoyimingii]|uniref:DUF2236 domain-containing protein n=1 Tax=Acinetobacter shaoyimingii TaxID=2715164 RepID=A0A6G8RU58_9GAMM|nr:oxygenase MpaB family protein [Acinetobacter shaoyimingii]QIO05360.1 DUF2236 domain-containing protein [Acinetobacter shaoyimingii]
MTPPRGMNYNFSEPKGSPALTPHHGISWRIFSNPVSLYIGGITAVLLELTEPSVASGVWNHSNFKTDTFGRLHRTGYAAMVTVYAPKEIAEQMIARVVKMHDQVQGINFLGQAYRANDPELLTWVQATALFGFTEAYSAFVEPLRKIEKDLAFIEGQTAAQLYGAKDLPYSWKEWEELYAQTQPRLTDSKILAEFVHIMQTADILPRPLKWLQILMVKAAIEIAPEYVKTMPSLKHLRLSFKQRFFLKLLAKLGHWFPLPYLPPSQAKKRMK